MLPQLPCSKQTQQIVYSGSTISSPEASKCDFFLSYAYFFLFEEENINKESVS